MLCDLSLEVIFTEISDLIEYPNFIDFFELRYVAVSQAMAIITITLLYYPFLFLLHPFGLDATFVYYFLSAFYLKSDLKISLIF